VTNKPFQPPQPSTLYSCPQLNFRKLSIDDERLLKQRRGGIERQPWNFALWNAFLFPPYCWNGVCLVGWWVSERFEASISSDRILIQLIFQGSPELFASMISLILVSIIVPMFGCMCGSVGKPVTNSCGIHKAPRTVESGTLYSRTSNLQVCNENVCSWRGLVNHSITLLCNSHVPSNEPPRITLRAVRYLWRNHSNFC